MTSSVEKSANDFISRLTRSGRRHKPNLRLEEHRTIQPRPLPGDLPEVPPMDEATLPESLRPWIMDVADRISCPPDFVGVGAMVALAAVVGRQIGIRPGQHDDWTVVPNLWGAVIGRPGVLKSPALSEVLKPLIKLEQKAKKQYLEALSTYEADRLIIESEREQQGQRIKKAIKEGKRDVAADFAANMVVSEPEPVRSRYLTQDTSTEKLGELLASNPRGLLVFRDELSGWLASLERSTDLSARSFYLEAWNGTGSFTYDRIGRGTIDIESATVSILGGIQPGPLTRYITQTKGSGAGDDGLLQRFQVVCWPDPSEWKEVDREPNVRASEAALEVWQRLDVIDQSSISANSESSIPFLRFDGEAQQEWRGWRQDLESRLRQGEETPAFESALAKYRSLVPSLALLIHLADNPKGGPVPIDCLLKAFAWAEYLEAHARRIYSPVLSEEVQAAKKLAAKILSGALSGPFKARDIHRKDWSGLDKAATQAGLEYLVELGWLFPEEKQDTGRPTTIYQINPECFA